MERLVAGAPDRQFWDHLRVMGNFGCWAHAWGADVSCAAALYLMLVESLGNGHSFFGRAGRLSSCRWWGGVGGGGAYAGRVCAIALIAVDTFTDDLAVDVPD